MLERLQLNKLAIALPDIPRWVETRSMLLSRQCEIFGLDEAGGELSFIACSTTTQLICVVGCPSQQAIEQAVTYKDDQCTLLTPPESRDRVAEVLQDWTSNVALLHLLGKTPHLPDIPEGQVRLLAPFEIGSPTLLPPDLQAELISAAANSPLAVTFVGDRPVSFCYAAAQTESLWDISIDTLVEYRNRGYAAMCVAYLIKHMHQQGKQPVWGAEQSNLPSIRLAAKLGFVPVDRIVVFQKLS